MTELRRLLPTLLGSNLIAEVPDGDAPAADDSSADDPAAARDAALTALADLYAYPDPLPDRGWVRASMVASVDGAAAGPDGLSGSLGGPVDRAVLATLRGAADVVLVSAGTARAEGYRLPRSRDTFADRRRELGQPPAPALAVVSRSGEVPDEIAAALHSAENDATGEPRAVLVTCAAADVAGLRKRYSDRTVLIAGDDDVDPARTLTELVARGRRRVLLEGGPGLLGRSIAAARVDELCLTLAPQLLAGDAPRISHGPLQQQTLRLTQLLVADSVLLGRWLVVSTPGV